MSPLLYGDTVVVHQPVDGATVVKIDPMLVARYNINIDPAFIQPVDPRVLY